MMPLGKIISEAGLSFKKYSRLVAIPVEMYDRQQHEILESNFSFGGKLFAKIRDVDPDDVDLGL